MRVFRLTEDGRPRVTEARRYLLLEGSTTLPPPATNYELREDGGLELREDGGIELREG